MSSYEFINKVYLLPFILLEYFSINLIKNKIKEEIDIRSDFFEFSF